MGIEIPVQIRTRAYSATIELKAPRFILDFV